MVCVCGTLFRKAFILFTEMGFVWIGVGWASYLRQAGYDAFAPAVYSFCEIITLPQVALLNVSVYLPLVITSSVVRKKLHRIPGCSAYWLCLRPAAGITNKPC